MYIFCLIFLKDYGSTAPSEFWGAFPFHPLPKPGEPNTQIDIGAFELECVELKHRLDDLQITWSKPY